MRIAKLFGAGLPRQRALVALVLLAGLAAALWLDAAHAQQADLAAPTGLAVEETSDSLTLSWAAVEDATGYEVRLGASGEVEAATGLSHEFTDLDEDTDYLLHVRAIDTTSSSSWASLSGRTLDPDLALPPQMVVRLYNSTPDVVVNWYHTPDATGYELRLDREGELVEMFTTTAYWHRYEDLPRDTQHRISVRSTKGSSRSAWLSKQFRTMREPLLLTFESSRELCTANTLTELSWTISGGAPPYTLSIDGEQIDPDSGPLRVNCGPLPVDLEGNTLSSGAKTFSASATDSYADPQTKTRSVEVDLAEPLPAPERVSIMSYEGFVRTWWERVPGVGLAPGEIDGEALWHDAYLVRYRAVDSSTWQYALNWRAGNPGFPWETPDSGVHEISVAALRDVLEMSTPAALTWSEIVRYAIVQPPANVTASATHNTVTVTWDRQPHTNSVTVSLNGGGGGLYKRFPPTREPAVGTAVFEHLPPATSFTAQVKIETGGEPGGWTRIAVQTEPAPPGFEPLPIGPQNLVVTPTGNTITVSWDPPFEGAPHRYSVKVLTTDYGRRVATQWVPAGETSVVIRGNISRLRPYTRYRVIVTHRGIPFASAEALVTTITPVVPPEQASAQAADVSPDELRLWWPLRIDNVFAVTDDPFDRREGYRYHAGLDIGAKDDWTARQQLIDHDRGVVQAAHAGILRVFNDRFTTADGDEPGYVLYCPDASLLFHERFHASNRATTHWDGVRLYAEDAYPGYVYEFCTVDGVECDADWAANGGRSRCGARMLTEPRGAHMMARWSSGSARRTPIDQLRGTGC